MQDGVVYSYAVDYRAFMGLKADGTFSFSSGAADSGYGNMQFTSEGYYIDDITYSESDANGDVTYYVDKMNSTEEAFNADMQKQYEKPEAQWHDFLNENIDAAF